MKRDQWEGGHRVPLIARWPGKIKPDASTDQKPLSDPRFNRWDENRDGKLARDELPNQLQRNFARVDTNSDGFISLEEHLRFIKRGRRTLNQNEPQRSLRTPDNATLHPDLPYAGTDNPRQKLDLLLPKKAGIDASLVAITDGEHGFHGAEIDARVDHFLEKHLMGKDVDVSNEPIRPDEN